MKKSDTAPKSSIAKRIEKMLIEEISTGQIEPGARLDETRLAKRFGASRTPVREALNRLLAQGILVLGGRRGVRVVEYTREELAQIFDAMFEIEAVCARMAARRLTLLARAEIEAAQADCVATAKAGNFSGYLEANERFHHLIYKATSNPFVAELASDFRQRTGPFRAKKFKSKADLLASAESHKSLLDSIFSADSSTADKGMRAHMSDSFLRVLAAT